MEEIQFSDSERLKLQNAGGLEILSISSQITKSDIVRLGQSERAKLREVLSTNAKVCELLDEIRNVPSPADAPAGETPEGQGKEAQKEAPPTGEPETEPEAPTQPDEETDKKHITFFNQLKKDGYSDLYIMARAYELGYIPKLHDTSFKIKTPTGTLRGWVSHKANWVFHGGFITNNEVLPKTSTWNRKAADAFKSVCLQQVDLERRQVKEILANAKKLPSLDKTLLETHFSILDRLKAAIDSGNMGATKSLFAEYRANYTHEMNNSFREFAKKCNIQLISTSLEEEKRRIQHELETRTAPLKGGSSLHTLDANKGALRKGDMFTLEKIAAAGGGKLEIEITEVTTAGMKANYRLFDASGRRIGFESGKLMTIHPDHVAFPGNPMLPEYRDVGIFDYKGTNSYLAMEKRLHDIETNLAKNPPDLAEASRLKKSYDTDFGRKLDVPDRRTPMKQALDSEKPEVLRVKKEVLAIDTKIEELKQKLLTKAAEFDKIAKADPTKAAQLKKDIFALHQDLNSQILDLEKRGVKVLSGSKLTAAELKDLSKTSKWLTGMEKLNGSLDKVPGSKTGKLLIGTALLVLVGGASKGILQSITNERGRRELVKDFVDLGMGAIPFVGGLHDWVISGAGIYGLPDKWEEKYRKLLGNRHESMTQNQKYIRQGFGVVGMIPLGSLGVKMLAKTAGSVALAHTAEGAVHLAGIAGKGFTYGYLGYTVATDVVPTAYHLAGGAIDKVTHKI